MVLTPQQGITFQETTVSPPHRRWVKSEDAEAAGRGLTRPPFCVRGLSAVEFCNCGGAWNQPLWTPSADCSTSESKSELQGLRTRVRQHRGLRRSVALIMFRMHLIKSYKTRKEEVFSWNETQKNTTTTIKVSQFAAHYVKKEGLRSPHLLPFPVLICTDVNCASFQV